MSCDRLFKSLVYVTAWLFTIIFIWLGIAQLGLLTQGLERVDWPRSQHPDEIVPPSESEVEVVQDEVPDIELPLEDDLPPESDQ